MRLLPRIFLIAALSGLASSYAVDANAFIVKAIRVQGLQGLSQETVLNYLPVQVGQDFDPSQSTTAIQALYATGLFNDVSLSQQGSTLVVTVSERPIIANVIVTGNKILTKDKLDPVLKSIGLVQGQVFDSAVLERIVHSLQSQYDSMGKYNAIITPTVTPEPRNRVLIKINISEGRSVVVKQIEIIGNHAYSEWRLKNELSLTTPRPWSFLTRNDLYSQDKLSDSMNALQSFYMDRGYLRFKIDSAQATLTPDRKFVYLVVHVTEGPIYTLKGYQLIGNLIVPQCKLDAVMKLKPGSVFSRQAIHDASTAITNLLGNMGYLFATVNVEPQIDDVTRQVYLTFYVEPGNQIYVRRINFIGNTKTADIALRQTLRQVEGSLASLGNIQESLRQLNLTGYMTSIHDSTVPVPGVPDQVDLNYNVEEAPSASATAGVGYGTLGWVVNAGITQQDFMGTGDSLGVNFSNSLYSTSYSVSFNNPYYTPDGVQRGFSLYYQRTTPGNVGITDFTTDMFGGTVTYSIPISANGDFLQLGYGYQNTLLEVGSDPTTQLQNFINSYGRHFNEILLNFGWSRNGLDRAVFPTRGLYQALSAQLAVPADDDSLEYYKVNYNFTDYIPITDQYIINTRGIIGYGGGYGGTHVLPFFANYYAGGMASNGEVRGFQSNTLGPKDTLPNAVPGGAPVPDDPLGGNELIDGSLNLIFPNPISQDRLRTSAFLDAGNVYSNKAEVISGTSAGPIRFSTGVEADWRVPVMNILLEVSLAKVLNAQPGDDTRIFDFNVGTSL